MPELLQVRKIARVIIPILLVIVICYVANATINQHFHKLSSGLVVKHAHPYDKGDTGKPFQDHHHSTSELVLLDQISNVFFRIHLFFLLLAPLLFIIEITTLPIITTFKNPDLYFLKNYHAPPETSY